VHVDTRAADEELFSCRGQLFGLPDSWKYETVVPVGWGGAPSAAEASGKP
jgi:hypothetical protein